VRGSGSPGWPRIKENGSGVGRRNGPVPNDRRINKRLLVREGAKSAGRATIGAGGMLDEGLENATGTLAAAVPQRMTTAG